MNWYINLSPFLLIITFGFLGQYPVLIGWLMHYANKIARQHRGFYFAKNKLLKMYGKYEGFDIQHIVKVCNACGGDGIYSYDFDRSPIYCNRCDNGIYAESWHKLERYKVGFHTFHNPIDSCSKYTHDTLLFWKLEPDFKSEIEGYIKHEYKNYGLCYECMLWISLLFSTKRFFKSMMSWGFREDTYYPYPLITFRYLFWQYRQWRIRRATAYLREWDVPF